MGMADNKCEVCGEPPVGVCCSTFGAISHAFCRECLELGRSPWTTIVGGLVGCTADTVHPGYLPFIEETCKFYGKTQRQLWAEVEKLGREWEDHLRKEAEDGTGTL